MRSTRLAVASLIAFFAVLATPLSALAVIATDDGNQLSLCLTPPPSSGQVSPSASASFKPVPAGLTPTRIDYHGGPIMSNPTIYIVSWGPGVDPSIINQLPDVYATLLDNNLTTQRGFASNLYQYSVPPTIIGPYKPKIKLVTISPHFAKSTLTSSDFVQEVNYQLSIGALPTPTSSLPYYFAFYFPLNMQFDIGSLCSTVFAYHGAIGNIVYALIPLCENYNFLDISYYSSHELAEAMTDPLLTSWWDSATGNEIADLCYPITFVVTPNNVRYAATSVFSNALYASGGGYFGVQGCDDYSPTYMTCCNETQPSCTLLTGATACPVSSAQFALTANIPTFAQASNLTMTLMPTSVKEPGLNVTWRGINASAQAHVSISGTIPNQSCATISDCHDGFGPEPCVNGVCQSETWNMCFNPSWADFNDAIVSNCFAASPCPSGATLDSASHLCCVSQDVYNGTSNVNCTRIAPGSITSPTAVPAIFRKGAMVMALAMLIVGILALQPMRVRS
jgi:hypothetical protein